MSSEFTTGFIVLATASVALSVQWRSWFAFMLGMSAPISLVPLYSWATIGTPFDLPYSYQATFQQMKRGLYAIEFPNPEIAWSLLFSPQRGLLFWSPFLVTSLLGYKAVSTNRRLMFVTYVIPLLHVAIISGRVWDWPAGPTFSARYLAPILPLLAVPCAISIQHYRKISVLLGILSVTLVTVATLTNATPSFNAHLNPLLTLNLMLLFGLDLNPSILSSVFGVPPLLALCSFFLLFWWFLHKSKDS